jgi:DNA-binding beta-propeller fold protein YncE
MKKFILLPGCLIVVLAFPPPGHTASPSGYRVLREIPMPDIEGWDYLTIDSDARRLFISNNSGIVIVDIDTLRQVGTVPQPPSFKGVGLVHGVAVATALRRGFISHEMPPSVYIFDLQTLAPLGVTATDRGTDAVVYDASTKRVFTLNSKQPGVHDATAIDAVSGQALGNIPLPGAPESAVTDGSGNLYVNIANRSTLARIDTRKLKLTATWPLAPCKEPGGLALDVAQRRLFATCDNKIVVMVDADSGKVLANVPAGEGTDAAAFDPATGNVFASNGAGTLTVAHEDSREKLVLIENVKTAPGARTMALDTTTHRVFLLAGEFGDAAPRSQDNPHGYPLAKRGTVKLLVLGPQQ